MLRMLPALSGLAMISAARSLSIISPPVVGCLCHASAAAGPVAGAGSAGGGGGAGVEATGSAAAALVGSPASGYGMRKP